LQKTERGASKSNKKVANSLVAMSSAAVLAVYAAGYVRTRPAADRLAERVYERPLARETPPQAPAHDASPATPPPTPSATAEPKRTTVVTPAAAASSAAPIAATVPSPSGETTSTPETPAPVAAPASAPVNSASAVVAPAASPQAEVSAAAPVAPAPPVWKDGKYKAWGTCRHGDIEATVVIEGGRITSAEITNCQTRYACDVIESLPPKVIQRQKNKFDIVGGATESAYAYYGAVYWALDQASK